MQTTPAKMKAFLRVIGLRGVKLNQMLTALNNRPIYDAPNARVAVSAIIKALPGHKYTTRRADHGLEYLFHIPGCGSIRINVHSIYPESSSPVFVTPYLAK